MKPIAYGSLISLMAALLLSARGYAGDYHVATDGESTGDGSRLRPWDLTTALANPAEVRPGDTIWLHAGTYSGGFVSRLKGERDNPIVVRAATGEHVTIDTNPRDERDNGLLLLAGADTVYRDFEVNCSHPKRETRIAGSWPPNVRRGSVDIRGDRISAINLVVHDQAGGFGFWSDGDGGQIYGCLIYNNGWQGPDRAHGHGVYVQNARGIKRIANNVVFHQFAYGIHAYGSDKASLRGLLIEGNIAFDNGSLARGNDRSPGIMVGGGCPAEDITVRDNVVLGGNIRLGYPWGTTNVDAVVKGNYCDGGFVLRDFRKATIIENVFAASSNVVQFEGADLLLKSGLTWDDNEYFVTDGRWGECALAESGKSQGVSFDQWRTRTGFDSGTKFEKGAPAKLRVVVRPNEYEQGGAFVCVINPEGLPQVDVDLSGVLKPEQTFRILSVKDVFGAPIVTGVYRGGAVPLPMKPVAAKAPVGMADAELPASEPYHATFVVRAGGK
jgi:hypothetical protein